SGRSRSARDSETNAYQTNCEAVDEIARQLRLRDQGGVVICDLIDMRMERHRKDIENRLAENLRKDRARTTFLPISEFGIVEMTRQRMRPSMRSMHFSNCTACKGLGELRSADSIAADTIRHASSLLSHDRVRRVEIVCSPRTASSLLSSHRRRLEQLENQGKRIDVRISETIGIDSFDLYAYDERNADLDTTRFPQARPPEDNELLGELPEESDGEPLESGTGRRRRRRRKPEPADATTVALSGGFDIPDEEEEDGGEDSMPSSESSEDGEPTEGGRKRRRRRRRRRGRGGQNKDDDATEQESANESQAADEAAGEGDAPTLRIHILAKELDVSSKQLLDICRDQLDLDLKTHMSSIPSEAAVRIREILAGTVSSTADAAQPDTAVTEDHSGDAASEGAAPEAGDDESEEGPPKKKRRRRRRRRGRRGGESTDGEEHPEQQDASDEAPAATEDETPAMTEDDTPQETLSTTEPKPENSPKPRRRGLYASQRRRVVPGSGEREDR
ncbi:MAG: translation initiation factor IF-2 N-terminal domain-containing protein, partial [Phycisphaerales bacterium]|nr:translation initiation factor IF-2 N-terminal domain-containing protein [Phycisphaerales bacterium]